MKIILTEEVVGLGEPGKLVDVAPGYARNFLVPRKLAVYANAGKIKELEHNKRRLERKRQHLVAAAMSTAERLVAQPITIEARVGQGGKLFGAITSRDIAEAIQQQLQMTIDRRKVLLREPIHSTGTYMVDLHLMAETHAQLTVHVVDVVKPAIEETAATPDLQPAPPVTEAEATEA